MKALIDLVLLVAVGHCYEQLKH